MQTIGHLFLYLLLITVTCESQSTDNRDHRRDDINVQTTEKEGKLHVGEVGEDLPGDENNGDEPSNSYRQNNGDGQSSSDSPLTLDQFGINFFDEPLNNHGNGQSLAVYNSYNVNSDDHLINVQPSTELWTSTINTNVGQGDNGGLASSDNGNSVKSNNQGVNSAFFSTQNDFPTNNNLKNSNQGDKSAFFPSQNDSPINNFNNKYTPVNIGYSISLNDSPPKNNVKSNNFEGNTGEYGDSDNVFPLKNNVNRNNLENSGFSINLNNPPINDNVKNNNFQENNERFSSSDENNFPLENNNKENTGFGDGEKQRNYFSSSNVVDDGKQKNQGNNKFEIIGTDQLVKFVNRHIEEDGTPSSTSNRFFMSQVTDNLKQFGANNLQTFNTKLENGANNLQNSNVQQLARVNNAFGTDNLHNSNPQQVTGANNVFGTVNSQNYNPQLRSVTDNVWNEAALLDSVYNNRRSLALHPVTSGLILQPPANFDGDINYEYGGSLGGSRVNLDGGVKEDLRNSAPNMYWYPGELPGAPANKRYPGEGKRKKTKKEEKEKESARIKERGRHREEEVEESGEEEEEQEDKRSSNEQDNDSSASNEENEQVEQQDEEEERSGEKEGQVAEGSNEEGSREEQSVEEEEEEEEEKEQVQGEARTPTPNRQEHLEGDDISDPFRPPPKDPHYGWVSEHEQPRDIPTRLNYPGGGLWAQPPPNVDLPFKPKQIYSQVRRHSTVKFLPREEAIAAAATAEELINAPRLREVISHKKTQQVYEEEGFEDTAYDHGAFNKHGEKKENEHKASLAHIPEDIIAEIPADSTIQERNNPISATLGRDHLSQGSRPLGRDHLSQGSKTLPTVERVTPHGTPKVRQWKTQMVKSNEKSLTYLNDDGQYQVHNERPQPVSSGVIGRSVEYNKLNNPSLEDKISKEIANSGESGEGGHKFNPSLMPIKRSSEGLTTVRKPIQQQEGRNRGAVGVGGVGGVGAHIQKSFIRKPKSTGQQRNVGSNHHQPEQYLRETTRPKPPKRLRNSQERAVKPTEAPYSFEQDHSKEQERPRHSENPYPYEKPPKFREPPRYKPPPTPTLRIDPGSIDQTPWKPIFPGNIDVPDTLINPDNQEPDHKSVESDDESSSGDQPHSFFSSTFVYGHGQRVKLDKSGHPKEFVPDYDYDNGEEEEDNGKNKKKNSRLQSSSQQGDFGSNSGRQLRSESNNQPRSSINGYVKSGGNFPRKAEREEMSYEEGGGGRGGGGGGRGVVQKEIPVEEQPADHYSSPEELPRNSWNHRYSNPALTSTVQNSEVPPGVLSQWTTPVLDPNRGRTGEASYVAKRHEKKGRNEYGIVTNPERARSLDHTSSRPFLPTPLPEAVQFSNSNSESGVTVSDFPGWNEGDVLFKSFPEKLETVTQARGSGPTVSNTRRKVEPVSNRKYTNIKRDRSLLGEYTPDSSDQVFVVYPEGVKHDNNEEGSLRGSNRDGNFEDERDSRIKNNDNGEDNDKENSRGANKGKDFEDEKDSRMLGRDNGDKEGKRRNLKMSNRYNDDEGDDKRNSKFLRGDGNYDHDTSASKSVEVTYEVDDNGDKNTSPRTISELILSDMESNRYVSSLLNMSSDKSTKSIPRTQKALNIAFNSSGGNLNDSSSSIERVQQLTSVHYANQGTDSMTSQPEMKQKRLEDLAKELNRQQNGSVNVDGEEERDRKRRKRDVEEGVRMVERDEERGGDEDENGKRVVMEEDISDRKRRREQRMKNNVRERKGIEKKENRERKERGKRRESGDGNIRRETNEQESGDKIKRKRKVKNDVGAEKDYEEKNNEEGEKKNEDNKEKKEESGIKIKRKQNVKNDEKTKKESGKKSTDDGNKEEEEETSHEEISDEISKKVKKVRKENGKKEEEDEDEERITIREKTSNGRKKQRDEKNFERKKEEEKDQKKRNKDKYEEATTITGKNDDIMDEAVNDRIKKLDDYVEEDEEYEKKESIGDAIYGRRRLKRDVKKGERVKKESGKKTDEGEDEYEETITIDEVKPTTDKNLELIKIQYDEKTTEIPVDVEMYPFYAQTPNEGLARYSPLRYAVNPKFIPRKTGKGMEFYDSRDHIECDEEDIGPSEDFLPEKKEDGELVGKPGPNGPRLKGLGDKIRCLRTKYFGSDPLDNPFFKEETVSSPKVFASERSNMQDQLGLYADIMTNIKANADQGGDHQGRLVLDFNKAGTGFNQQTYQTVRPTRNITYSLNDKFKGYGKKFNGFMPYNSGRHIYSSTYSNKYNDKNYYNPKYRGKNKYKYEIGKNNRYYNSLQNHNDNTEEGGDEIPSYLPVRDANQHGEACKHYESLLLPLMKMNPPPIQHEASQIRVNKRPVLYPSSIYSYLNSPGDKKRPNKPKMNRYVRGYSQRKPYKFSYSTPSKAQKIALTTSDSATSDSVRYTTIQVNKAKPIIHDYHIREKRKRPAVPVYLLYGKIQSRPKREVLDTEKGESGYSISSSRYRRALNYHHVSSLSPAEFDTRRGEPKYSISSSRYRRALNDDHLLVSTPVESLSHLYSKYHRVISRDDRNMEHNSQESVQNDDGVVKNTGNNDYNEFRRINIPVPMFNEYDESEAPVTLNQEMIVVLNVSDDSLGKANSNDSGLLERKVWFDDTSLSPDAVYAGSKNVETTSGTTSKEAESEGKSSKFGGKFISRHSPAYSSRYNRQNVSRSLNLDNSSASTTDNPSLSTAVEKSEVTENVSEDTTTSVNTDSTIITSTESQKLKVKFPKLTVKPTVAIVPDDPSKIAKKKEGEKSTPKPIITTTTTTTEGSPTSTTRMYKPKRVFKKDSNKVVDAFAVLPRVTTEKVQSASTVVLDIVPNDQPVEEVEVEKTTNPEVVEVKKHTNPSVNNFRSNQEQKTSNPEVVEVKKPINPSVNNFRSYQEQKRSSKDEGRRNGFDKSNGRELEFSLFNHPDLRDPTARVGRVDEEGAASNKEEIIKGTLMYVVDPLTGIGRWETEPNLNVRVPVAPSPVLERDAGEKKRYRHRGRSRYASSRSRDTDQAEDSVTSPTQLAAEISQQALDESGAPQKKNKNQKIYRHNSSSKYAAARNRGATAAKGHWRKPSSSSSSSSFPVTNDDDREQSSSTQKNVYVVQSLMSQISPLQQSPLSRDFLAYDDVTHRSQERINQRARPTFPPKVIVEPDKRMYYYLPE